MKHLFLSLLLVVATTFSADWSSTHIEGLYGTNYELGDPHAVTFTGVHANGWRFGDNFAFVDVARGYESGSLSLYAEYSPRISVLKIANTKFEKGPIADILASFNFEMANGLDFVYNTGVAVDFKVPNVNFLQLNGYVRNDPRLDGVTFQVTTAWQVPIGANKIKFVFDGFIDWIGEEGNDIVKSEMQLISQPAIYFDLGNLWGADQTLFVGMEYALWINKYGVDGINDNLPQVAMRWVF